MGTRRKGLGIGFYFCLIAFSALASCSVPADRTPEMNPRPIAVIRRPRPTLVRGLIRGARGIRAIPTLFRWTVSRSAYTGQRRDPPEVPRVENDGSSFATQENSAAVTWVGHSDLCRS